LPGGCGQIFLSGSERVARIDVPALPAGGGILEVTIEGLVPLAGEKVLAHLYGDCMDPDSYLADGCEPGGLGMDAVVRMDVQGSETFTLFVETSSIPSASVPFTIRGVILPPP
jgi:hypothetical protein